MASTYIAGVFLTVCTYEGPQLVYHHYDHKYADSLDRKQEAEARPEFDWSDDDFSEDDSPVSSSPSSSRNSLASLSQSTSNLSQGLSIAESLVPWKPAAGASAGSSVVGSAAVGSVGAGSSTSTGAISRKLGMSIPISNSTLSQGLQALSTSAKIDEPSKSAAELGPKSAPDDLPASEPAAPQLPSAEDPVPKSAADFSQSEQSYESVMPAGLDEEIIAETLSPPDVMCNERFSLTVENCTFVGIPVHILDSGTWRPLKKGEPSEPTGDNEQSDNLAGVVTEKDSPMRMFHVTFVIFPPINEATKCEERLYRSVLVPFVRLLRQEQASKNYVWEQVSLMLKTQEKMAHLGVGERKLAVENASELAASLRKMYSAVAQMDISRVFIAGKPRAFQVPLQLEMMHLPAWYDEPSSQAYLNSSNDPEKEITHDVYTCYGLLLLDDPETIVEEIDVDPQGPVAAMIRSIDPTSSLDGLSRQNNIEIGQIVNLVWSLVYWRRARIIIPLHIRHTYGVSPLAPKGDRFYVLAKTFNSIFPMMPPIQKLLALLSNGKPKPFAVHIPTNDHRQIYMQSLAWLLQNDFIVHLPTFALITIPRKIKLSAHTSTSAVEEEQQNGDQKGLSNFRSISYRTDPDDLRDTAILDPRKASTVEKRWLSQVMISGATRNPDQAALFQRLTKYFNGKDCLEQVMIHEKITRESMRAFLQEFSQYVITYKHW